MFSKANANIFLTFKRNASANQAKYEAYIERMGEMFNSKIPKIPTEASISEKEKVALCYHLFEQYYQLTDGSVVKRFSQFPKRNIISLRDQRSNIVYNPMRPDLAQKKIQSSTVDKFKLKFGAELFNAANIESTTTDIGESEKKPSADLKEQSLDGGFNYDEMDDFLSLLDSVEDGSTSGKDKK